MTGSTSGPSPPELGASGADKCLLSDGFERAQLCRPIISTSARAEPARSDGGTARGAFEPRSFRAMGVDTVVGGADADALTAIWRLFHVAAELLVALALRPLHHYTG
jgi:hypothetical protein